MAAPHGRRVQSASWRPHPSPCRPDVQVAVREPGADRPLPLSRCPARWPEGGPSIRSTPRPAPRGSRDPVGLILELRVALDAGFGDDAGPMRLTIGHTLKKFVEALRRPRAHRAPLPPCQTPRFLGQQRRQRSVGAACVLGQPARPRRRCIRTSRPRHRPPAIHS